MIITGKYTKSIVLYGDSLVYGKQSGVNARLPADMRFAGVLQTLLGSDFDIIPEGLRARTMYGENPHFSERDGYQQFGPIIGSHLPVDLVVLFLGTNDCNSRTPFEPLKIAGSLKDYMQKIKEWTDYFEILMPKVLVILPPDIDESSYDQSMQDIFGRGASMRVKELRPALAKTADELSLPSFDSSQVCAPAWGDGIHLDAENNRSLAVALEKVIRGLLV